LASSLTRLASSNISALFMALRSLVHGFQVNMVTSRKMSAHGGIKGGPGVMPRSPYA
jgi:hypothetical protein